MAGVSYLTRLSGSIRRNIEQVQLFGPSILGRFVKARQNIYRVNLRNFGPISVRLEGSDVSTFVQVFERQEYDLAGIGSAIGRVNRHYRRILNAGQVPVIIDAGANVGAATLWFHRLFPDAAIVAIEPEPGNAAVLRENAVGRAQVTVVEAAIAAKPGAVVIADGSTGWDVQTERVESGGIAAITMSDAFALVPNGAPFIAKIDIEGFESDLFASDLEWIDEMAMILIEPHDWMLPGQFSSQGFQKAMGARRFELFINGENLIYVAE